MSTNKVVTKSDLKDFYDRIYPYLGAGVQTGFTPVGTVISVMGVNAPANYLKCDGTVYYISDYPVLAKYFETEFGSKNKFGGDGTSTFAVPDLRGEFLRGTGTNSHANQGSGSAVGTHQDATQHIAFTTGSGNLNYGTVTASNTDKNLSSGARNYISKTGAAGSEAVRYYTARPTNTSVLYCIATKNIYIDAKYDYSTDEKVVGTWIDGKPLYQKTIEFDSTTYTDAGARRQFILTTLENIDKFSSVEAAYSINNGTSYLSGTTFAATTTAAQPQSTIYGSINTTTNILNISLQCQTSANVARIIGWVTVKYTKTTD